MKSDQHAAVDVERHGAKGASDGGSSTSSLQCAAAIRARRNRLMAACSCILGNETAERLAYCEPRAACR